MPTEQDLVDFADLLQVEIKQRWYDGRSLPLNIPIIAKARKKFGLDLFDSKKVHELIIDRHREDLEAIGYDFAGQYCLIPPKHPSRKYDFDLYM